MLGFRRMQSLQKVDAVHNLFNQERSLSSREEHSLSIDLTVASEELDRFPFWELYGLRKFP